MNDQLFDFSLEFRHENMYFSFLPLHFLTFARLLNAKFNKKGKNKISFLCLHIPKVICIVNIFWISKILFKYCKKLRDQKHTRNLNIDILVNCNKKWKINKTIFASIPLKSIIDRNYFAHSRNFSLLPIRCIRCLLRDFQGNLIFSNDHFQRNIDL